MPGRREAKFMAGAAVLLLALQSAGLALADDGTGGLAPGEPGSGGPAPGEMANEAAAEALEENPRLAFNPYGVLVRWDPALPEDGRAAVRALVEGVTAVDYDHVGDLELVETPLPVDEAVARLRGQPGVLDVQRDLTLRSTGTTNDPDLASLWGLAATPGADVRGAWDLTTGSPGVVVADIDDGIDLSHPDLAGAIWTNPREVAGNGVDDDGNGFVDDVRGWDFVANDNDPSGPGGHGTHTAGTIAATGNNGVGVAGVAYGVRLLPLKFLNDSGSGYTSDAIEALDYAVALGVRISNNSWGGGGFNTTLYNAIKRAGDSGHLFVAAAGNSGTNSDVSPSYPAAYDLPNIISVAAIDSTGHLASFSNYGVTTVDLAAPGVSIRSTVPGGYAYYSGTSMATPHVAGTAALMLSRDPTLPVTHLRSLLLTSVTTLPALAGKVATGGTLSAARAVAAVSAPVPAPAPTPPPAPGLLRLPGGTAGPPALQVTSPSAGAQLTAGSTVTIAWSATSRLASAITVEVVPDAGGAAVTQLVGGGPASGSVAWLVNVPAGTYRVVVRESLIQARSGAFTVVG